MEVRSARQVVEAEEASVHQVVEAVVALFRPAVEELIHQEAVQNQREVVRDRRVVLPLLRHLHRQELAHWQ